MATNSKSGFGNFFSSSSKNEAEKQHDIKTEEMREEKEQEGSESPDEKRKMVMHGAKIQCKYMPAPGSLLVTSNTIKMQDQLWATEGDCGKMNLQFQGACMHSKWSYNKPPCISVIAPTKWEDLGTTLVQDKKVLLKSSTIKCSISNEKITILFDGQTCTPATLTQSETDAVTKSNFNAVIQFYKSIDHSNGKYGTNDSSYSGEFGFDKFDKKVNADGLIEKYQVLGSVIQKKENISGHKQYLCSYLSIWPPGIEGNSDNSKSIVKLYVKAEEAGTPSMPTDLKKDEVEFTSSDPSKVCFSGGAESLKKILTLNNVAEALTIECKGKFSGSVTITAKAQGSAIGQLIVVPNDKCFKTIIQPVRLKFDKAAVNSVSQEENVPFLINLIDHFNKKSMNQACIYAELASKTDIITLDESQFSNYLSSKSDGNNYLIREDGNDKIAIEYNDLVENRYASLLVNQDTQNKAEEKLKQKLKNVLELFDKKFDFPENSLEYAKKSYSKKIATTAWNNPKVQKAFAEYEIAKKEYDSIGTSSKLNKNQKIHIFLTDSIYGAGNPETRVPAYSCVSSGVTHLFGSALTDPASVAITIHELGHALGLKHTFDKLMGTHVVPQGTEDKEDLNVKINNLKNELKLLEDAKKNTNGSEDLVKLKNNYARIEKAGKSISWFYSNLSGFQPNFIDLIKEAQQIESNPLKSSTTTSNNDSRISEIKKEIVTNQQKQKAAPKRIEKTKIKDQSETLENYMDYNQDSRGGKVGDFKHKVFYKWQWDDMRNTGAQKAYFTEIK